LLQLAGIAVAKSGLCRQKIYADDREPSAVHTIEPAVSPIVRQVAGRDEHPLSLRAKRSNPANLFALRKLDCFASLAMTF
jgi:hypothetical protein